jgi:hypothetical protein
MAEKTVDIGWINTWPQAGFAFPRPRLLDDDRVPASLRGRIAVLYSPVDAVLRYAPDAPQGCVLAKGSRLRQAGFEGLVTCFEEQARRRADIATVQIALNVVFVSDARCTLSLMPAFLSDGPRAWPGPLVAGRFPFRDWPRPLNLAIEWEDTDRDWVLRRGEPVAYVLFDLPDPTATVRLVEAEATPELARHRRAIDGVATIGRDVRPMIERAGQRRPARLLKPKVQA